MIIVKILNNNAVVTIDKNKKELVVLGKGIGFGKKEGDEVEKSNIDKIYTLPTKQVSQFERLVLEMPYEHIALADEIIKYASKVLGKELNKNIYITLTDHVNFAIERTKKNILLNNALLWEIKRFYSDEYEIGLKSLEMIMNKTGVKLTDDEAGFIALHIVNAQTNKNMDKTVKSTNIIKNILDIVKKYFDIEFDENSISYERFITHLKFLVQRIESESYYSNDDEEFYLNFLNKHKESAGCAKKISDYISETMDYTLKDEELMYLTVHIERIVVRIRL